MRADDQDDQECRQDFDRWCSEQRLLGRDRLWPAFRDGWAYGFATATDQAEQGPQMEDHDR